MSWFDTLYTTETEQLHQERALNLARDAAVLRHVADRAPLGGIGGDLVGLKDALGQVLGRFSPEVGREALWRTTNADPNPVARRPSCALGTTRKCFYEAWDEVRRRPTSDLPHVSSISVAGAAAADSGGDGSPLTVFLGDVLEINGGTETYYGLVVQLFDPQTAQATHAAGLMARLWRAAEFCAVGEPAAAALLGDGEVALSTYFDWIRPASIVGRLQLVPECWRDPDLPLGREVFVQVRGAG